MLTETLKKLAEMEPEKFKCGVSVLRPGKTNVVCFTIMNGDGTIKDTQDSCSFTQDFYDAILAELSWECEIIRSYDTDKWTFRAYKTYRIDGGFLRRGRKSKHTIDGNNKEFIHYQTKLAAIQSCLDAVVNDLWEKRGKK